MKSKSIIGIVVSAKMDKTAVVEVTQRKTHPVYKKQYTRTKKFKIHDEKNELNIGDKVSFTQTRPLSKDKSHTLVKVVEKSKE